MSSDKKSGATLRLGILGAADIATKNVRAIRLCRRDIVVVAVASRSEDKARGFIKSMDLDQAKPYTYESIITDADLDALYIPLPTGLHKEWVQKAAAAKIHVLVEKPIALSAEDTDAIVAMCADAGVQFMDGSMWIHSPRVKALEAVLRDRQAMGELVTVHSIFHNIFPGSFMKDDVRVKKGLDGLGAMGDIGWYCIGNILMAYGWEAPQLVQAAAGPIFNDEGVLMHGGATLVWKDGRRGTFDVSFRRTLTQYMQVGGTHGMLEWTGFCQPAREDKCDFIHTGPGTFKWLEGTVEQDSTTHTVDLDVPQDSAMWEAFADCIHGIKAGKPPDPFWPHIACLTNKLVCCVLESAENGCVPVHFKP